MRRPVLASGVSRRRLRVIENWAPREVEEAARTASPRAPADAVVLLYSGNLGRAHDLSILADAVGSLSAGTRLRIVFQASGPGAHEVREMFRDVPVRVEWRSPVPRADLPRALREAHWHVVSVKPGFERLLVPSKTYAPLALGLPVIVLGPAGSEPARIVRRTGCGVVWSTAAEAVAGLATLTSGEVPAPPSGAALLRREAGLRAWVELLADLAPERTPATSA
jgi:hypothetical protein